MFSKELSLVCVCAIYVCNLICYTNAQSITIPNATNQDSTVAISTQYTANSCLLVPALPNAAETIAGFANSDKQLVMVSVAVKANNGTYITKDIRLKHWVIATSLTGQSMLMLKETFDAMSLYTLGLGVESYSVTLNPDPPGCLNGKGFKEIEKLIRSKFLSNFGSSDHSLPSGAEICNKDIGKQEGNRDRLVYVCCKNNQDNQLECSEITRTIWIQLLFISIIILQVLIILYSPVYMPDFMYKAKSIFQKFIFTTEPDKLLQLRVKVVTEASNADHGYLKAELQNFTHLEKFKQHLESLETDKIHTLMVKGVEMCVRDSKIVAEGSAPVSVLTFLKDFFVRCKMRYDISSVSDCCMQDMWVKVPCKVVFRWYQCLSGIMMLISAVVLASPWLLRIWFYYAVEEEKVENQKEIYDTYDFKIPYPGNLVTYFSPAHPFFTAIHILFGVEILVFIVLPGAMKEKVKFTVRKCFRDTRDKSKLDACGLMASHMLRPLKSYGIVGCVLLPLWFIGLPFYCLAIAIEVIPIANLSVRLLVNLVYYISKVINPNIFKRGDQQVPGTCSLWMEKRFNTIIVKNENEANTRLNKLLHTLALIMTFVTVWLFLVLLVECISFYVECAVYALVGFILNPRSILKYVSLILLIAVYGNECFSGVHGRYAAYSTGINSEVQGMVGDKMTEEAAKSKETQRNTAFRVPAKSYIPERLCLMTGPEGFLKWKVSRLALFLDTSDTPYIPTSFLFQMGQMNHFQCPGKVYLLYLKALLDFVLIFLFLIFVFIVIFAFGQAEDISSAGQAIAALGTGFFPLILRKFLFQTQGYSLDRSNLHWKNMFINAVQKYSEKWNFEDIIIAQMDEMEHKPPETDGTPTETDETTEAIASCGVTEESDTFTDVFKVNETFINKSGTSGGNIPTIPAADLIVQRGKISTGQESMIFFVPLDNVEVDSIYTLYTEDETIL